MKIVIYTLDKVKQRLMGDHLLAGFMQHGENVKLYPDALAYHLLSDNPELADADLAVMIGGQSFGLFDKARKRTNTLFVDKVFAGRRDYYRMVLNGPVPCYMQHIIGDPAKLAECGVELKPRVRNGRYIIYAGSSQAYCTFHGLGDALDYDAAVCHMLLDLWRSPDILYRMKASLVPRDENKQYATPTVLPGGVIYSPPNVKLAELLPNCHCLVTYGSNAACEAIAAGVPVLMLSPKGVNPVRPLCETDINRLDNPYWPPLITRQRLFEQMADVQFSVDQIRSGEAWGRIKDWVGVKVNA